MGLRSSHAMPSASELRKNLRALKRRLESHPMDLDARMRVARTQRLLGKKDDAVAHYTAVARYLSLAGHPSEAIAVLNELLQVEPTHGESLLFLAKLRALTRASGAPPAERSLETLEQGLPPTRSGVWRAITPPALDEDQAADAHVDPDAAAIGAETAVDDADVFDVADEGADEGTDDHADEVPSAPDGGEHGPANAMIIPAAPLFAALTPDALLALSHAMIQLHAEPGEVLFEEGQPGDSCLVIAKGTARVSRRGPDGDVEIVHVGEGDIAGIFALAAPFGSTRQATLTAVSAVEYFEIDKIAVDELVRAQPSMRVALMRFFRDRLLLHLLASLPFFQSLPTKERRELAARFTDRDYQPGDELFFEGAEHDGIWVVLEGTVRLGRDVDGRFEAQRQLDAGMYVGSLARLDDAAADLSAQAVTVTRCALLTHRAFSGLLEAHEDIKQAREMFRRAGVMVGEHVFAGGIARH